MKHFLFPLLLWIAFAPSFAQQRVILPIRFGESPLAPTPNYTKMEHWAALPTKKDEADKTPVGSSEKDKQSTAQADVFFIHPTLFMGIPAKQYQWNAEVENQELNKMVDESTILNQASAFNGSCRVYAPRYRQAHLYAFFTPNKEDMKQCLELAYSDVKAAFEYYLAHFNEGRPIVIASHSQGTVHAKWLLRDFFDGKPLQKQLVTAYLVGMDVRASTFQEIKACESADETGCFNTWNTFAKGFYPSDYEVKYKPAISTNPLTWKLDEEYAPRILNKGGVGLGFKFVKKPNDAQNHQGLLWINKPHITGRAFIRTKVWHKADYNLFWQNIRENTALRIASFLK